MFPELSDYRLVAKWPGRDPSSVGRGEKGLKIREFRTARALIEDLINEQTVLYILISTGAEITATLTFWLLAGMKGCFFNII